MKRDMKTTRTLIALAAVTLALPLGGAAVCGTPLDQEGCRNDNDCVTEKGNDSWTCAPESGECLCKNDSACDAATEYCNPQGYCQERAGCSYNADCEAPLFCDTTTGECLDPRSTSKNCSLDTHCPFLYFCDGRTCVPGCQDSGDCPLGFGCLMNTCVQGGCTTRGDCEYGERCVSNSCQRAIDGQTCQDCTCPDSNPFCSNILSCVSDSNHTCLVNTAYDVSDSSTYPENYCVPDCSTNEDCPWGFDCDDIFGVVDVCSAGETCSNGQTCRVGSEATRGYCPCTADSDCTMMGLPGPCTSDGLCLSGRSCGLFLNLLCADVGVTP